ncbi:hypothetical protein I3842_03G201200 [Carya illinoinensis]|uniref:Uncharacterized protein n=1 Tax=Carya illinoinensis TaxID=32201 RepID=A0A922FM55_CARIL|nr:hypothetical protein I3842_03G201200 [Carya illinoinensis]
MVLCCVALLLALIMYVIISTGHSMQMHYSTRFTF